MTDRGTILLIEDDVELARMYRTVLQGRHFRVLVAPDGETGVRLALEQSPRLIVLDLLLPKQGGLHVLKVLKSLPETKDIPVVTVTAYPNPEYQEEATKSGASLHLLKTEVSAPQVADAVERLLSSQTG